MTDEGYFIMEYLLKLGMKWRSVEFMEITGAQGSKRTWLQCVCCALTHMNLVFVNFQSFWRDRSKVSREREKTESDWSNQMSLEKQECLF